VQTVSTGAVTLAPAVFVNAPVFFGHAVSGGGGADVGLIARFRVVSSMSGSPVIRPRLVGGITIEGQE
jgi:hypothetical protein